MPLAHAPESHRDPPSKRVGTPSVLALVACASLLGLAGPSCGSSGTTSGAGSGGASGTVGSGGAGAVLGGAGTGGAAATGGTTAISGTGGTAATGGMLATGGTSALGGAGGVGGGGGASVGGAGSGGSGASGGNGVGGAQGGGGGGSTGASGGAGVSGGAGGGVGGFALTSPTLTEGGMFPAVNTCAGADSSPELDWTSGPATASSYALVLTDMAINLVHWVVWDIPVATRSLPAMLATTATLTTPVGARQVAASGTGYMGPCPSGNVHTYQFDLHALDVATLPTVPANPTSAQVKALVMMHSLALTSLSAQSNAKRP